mmetsp:Transcript_131121/g.355941  ORF Transcript_131121/g.355941 Transcript_131121/m.355941 type:complete len:681 (+) Transcript_131121:147-2189(+)
MHPTNVKHSDSLAAAHVKGNSELERCAATLIDVDVHILHLRANRHLWGASPLRPFGHLPRILGDVLTSEHLNPLPQGCPRDEQLGVLLHIAGNGPSQHRGCHRGGAEAVGQRVVQAVAVARLLHHSGGRGRLGPLGRGGGPRERLLHFRDLPPPRHLRKLLHLSLVLQRRQRAWTQSPHDLHRLARGHLGLTGRGRHGLVQPVRNKEASKGHARCPEPVAAVHQAAGAPCQSLGNLRHHVLPVVDWLPRRAEPLCPDAVPEPKRVQRKQVLPGRRRCCRELATAKPGEGGRAGQRAPAAPCRSRQQDQAARVRISGGLRGGGHVEDSQLFAQLVPVARGQRRELPLDLPPEALALAARPRPLRSGSPVEEGAGQRERLPSLRHRRRVGPATRSLPDRLAEGPALAEQRRRRVVAHRHPARQEAAGAGRLPPPVPRGLLVHLRGAPSACVPGQAAGQLDVSPQPAELERPRPLRRELGADVWGAWPPEVGCRAARRAEACQGPAYVGALRPAGQQELRDDGGVGHPEECEHRRRGDSGAVPAAPAVQEHGPRREVGAAHRRQHRPQPRPHALVRRVVLLEAVLSRHVPEGDAPLREAAVQGAVRAHPQVDHGPWPAQLLPRAALDVASAQEEPAGQVRPCATAGGPGARRQLLQREPDVAQVRAVPGRHARGECGAARGRR